MYFRFIAISAALVVVADASTLGDLSPHNAAADTVETRSDQDQLLVAFESGDEEGFQSLIQSGVDLDFQYPDGSTLLMKAIGVTPLSPYASYEERKQRRNEMAKLLILNGANPNLGANGSSPLLEALRGNKIELARLLIENRANPNFIDRFRETSPLIEVARSSSPEAVNIAELLIQHGANPNLEFTHYPLLEALYKKNIGLVNLLIERGANPNIRDLNLGNTPLIIVTRWKEGAESVEIANLLINRGADPNLADTSGHHTPLIDAIRSGHNIAMVELFINNNANVNQAAWETTPLICAIYSGVIDMIQLLIRHGANVDLPSRNGSVTPIIAAVLTGNVDTLNFVLNLGADPNQATQRGETPLKRAVLNGDVEMVKALADHPGVEVDDAYEFAKQTLTLVSAINRVRRAILEAIVKALEPRGPLLK